MKKTLQSLVRKGLTYAEALLLLTSLNACNDTEVEITKPPVASATLYPETTQSPETTGFVSQDETTGEEITNEETTLSPETTKSPDETTTTSQEITQIETTLIPESSFVSETTSQQSQDITVTETQQAPETTPTVNDQLEKINALIEMAYAYDHDLAKNGIGSIHIKWPQSEKHEPFEVIISAQGANHKDESNFKFEIDKKVALKFITTMDRDLSKLPEGLSPNRIYEMSSYALYGVRFTPNNSNKIINKYLSLFLDYIPEKPFYFEDKQQISDEQSAELNNYLCTVNQSYKNGIFSISLTQKDNENNKKAFTLEVFPCAIDDYGQTIINWNMPRFILQISEHEFTKYSDLLTLNNCYKTVVEKQGQTIYDINLTERIPDTLKKQILNLVYNTMVEYKKINTTSLER